MIVSNPKEFESASFSGPRTYFPRLAFEMQESNLESLLEEFEESFAKGASPSIESYLSRYNGESDKALLEFVLTDIELRIKRGEKVRVEQYLSQFEVETSDKTAIRDLIATEFRVRNRYESDLSLREYVLRFPEHYDCLMNLRTSVSSNIGELWEPSLAGSFTDSARRSRFRKRKITATGGLGNVWLARDQELDRNVALKEIKDKYANDGQHQERFIKEALITGSLEHPGIIPIYGMGRFQDGRPFYAMRMVNGNSLQALINEYHENAGSRSARDISFRRLARNFTSLCNAIHFAHQRGVIHRDIKPSNTMIDEHGETLVVDWGLAKVLDEASFQEVVDDHNKFNSWSKGEIQSAIMSDDQTGEVMGSPAFMSPEQSQGLSDRLSIRSDVYSLGATLLSLLTGEGNPNSTLRKDKPQVKLRVRKQLPKGLRPLLSVCEMAMKDEPDQRYQSAKDLSDDVERFLADQDVFAHQESVVEKFARFSRSNRRLVDFSLAALALIALVSIVAALMINDALNRSRQDHKVATKAKKVAIAEREKAQGFLEELRTGFDTIASLFAGQTACGLKEDVPLSRGLEKLKNEYLATMSPRLKAMMHHVFAQNHHGEMRIELAEKEYDQAIALSNEYFGDVSPTTIQFKSAKAALLQQSGRLDEAYNLAFPLIESCELEPEENEHSLYTVRSVLAVIEAQRGRFEEAMEHADLGYAQTIAVYQDAGEEHCLKLQTLRIAIMRETKDFSSATKDCTESIELLNQRDQQVSPVGIRLLTERARIGLAEAKFTAGGLDNLTKILADLELAREYQTQLFGPTHLNTRLVDLDIACAQYSHPNSTTQQIRRSIELLTELKLIFEKDFSSNTSHREQIRMNLARARKLMRFQ
jgi:serine/threonine protein kinase/tetratricopeptide (TPR) repeat protein